MKLGLSGVLAIIAVILGLTGLYYLSRFFTKDSFDPTSDKNLAYQGSNKIVQILTGDKNATLGTKIYDAVQSIKDFLPFIESEREIAERRNREYDIAVLKARANKRRTINGVK